MPAAGLCRSAGGQRLSGLGRALSTSSAAALPPASQLYREVLRSVRQLPKASRTYYRNYARQLFANWEGETDPDVLRQLHDKARHDAAWVLQKYAKPS